MTVLGFDTSNYTTSVALCRDGSLEGRSRLLDVPEGQLGLRQSEALFMHVKRLPDLAAALSQSLEEEISAVGASSAPREVEGSYMPCFLAGLSQAETMASLLHVPCFRFSHQQGHIAAVAYGAGRPELLEQPMLAWHLSGGTTELLLVRPENGLFTCTPIGGTTDISAGQLIDRTGKLLGLRFPAGKELDKIASPNVKPFRVKLEGLSFSLSGMENKVKSMVQSGGDPGTIAGFVLSTVISAVWRASQEARSTYGNLPLVFTGGVSSNSLLRSSIPGGVFAPPQYSTDNAYGVAALTWRALTAQRKGRNG